MTKDSARGARLQRPTPLYAPSGQPLDETDVAILYQLQREARFSVKALAQVVGLSHGGMLNRLNRLDETGVVLRHRADIDERVFEAWPPVLIELVLTLAGRRDRASLDREILETPEILEATELVGDSDLLLKVALPAPRRWPEVQAQLDPTATLIAEARLKIIGRTVKPPSPHPLLRVQLEGD